MINCDHKLIMTTEVDIITKRPRTPNDQYTVLTDEQIRNIDQDRSTFFNSFKPSSVDPTYGPPREGGRYYMDRYCALTSGHLLTGHHPTHMWIGEQKRNDLLSEYNCCRGLASVKWGPQKIGESTRSHFYGENVERYTLIDAYRRPPTCYAGRVVMDCGRPADGYYAQRFPDRVTWFKSSVPLNCTNILQSVHRKPRPEYKRMLSIEQMVRREREKLWPDYSEYTDKYLLRSRVPPKLSGLDRQKLHAAYGQKLQKLEMEERAALLLEEQTLRETMKDEKMKAMPSSECKPSECQKMPVVAF